MKVFKDAIFWLKNSLFRYNAIRCYHEAIAAQKLPIDGLAQLNWEKRKKIVEHAYHHVTFYRQYYDEKKFHPSMLKSETDWSLVPVLEKQMIRDHTLSFIDPVAKRWIREATTGGSTGVPLKLYHDMRFPYEILGWRMLSWWSISPACDKALVWRIPTHRKGRLSKIKDSILWWPTRRIYIDASVLKNSDIRNFIIQINKYHPEIILGYVGAIEQIALYAKHNKLEIFSPRIIWATSAPLSEIQRSLFAQIFKCPIIDQYGSCEVMWIASNCQQTNNLHLYADCRHIDILDDDDQILPDGIIGNIAITDLENNAFPLIKYKNGDQSSYIGKPCSCGLNLPLITPIKGRNTECIYLPDKTVIAGDYLTTIFDDYTDYVEKFQIIQHKDFSIDLNVVAKAEMTFSLCRDKISMVADELQKKTGGQVPIRTNITDKISNDKGKIRYIISELSH